MIGDALEKSALISAMDLRRPGLALADTNVDLPASVLLSEIGAGLSDGGRGGEDEAGLGCCQG